MDLPDGTRAVRIMHRHRRYDVIVHPDGRVDLPMPPEVEACARSLRPPPVKAEPKLVAPTVTERPPSAAGGNHLKGLLWLMAKGSANAA